MISNVETTQIPKYNSTRISLICSELGIENSNHFIAAQIAVHKITNGTSELRSTYTLLILFITHVEDCRSQELDAYRFPDKRSQLGITHKKIIAIGFLLNVKVNRRRKKLEDNSKRSFSKF